MTKEELKQMIESLKTWQKRLDKNRGERAELRRAKSILEVIMTPSFQRLCTHLNKEIAGFNDNDKEKLAFIVGLLSHVKEPSNTLLARAMSAGSPSCVSELRFRRLLQHSKDDHFYIAMIRIIRMLKYHASISDLVKSMYYWNDNTKKQWAYAYFG